jgi:hypothetical protein
MGVVPEVHETLLSRLDIPSEQSAWLMYSGPLLESVLTSSK